MDKELIRITASLASSSPELWKLFIAELNKRRNTIGEEFLNAPPKLLQVAQGRAKEATYLYYLLEGAVKTADRISNGGMKKT